MKRRILIVEDEAVTSVLLEKTLKELGYEVVGSAFDGTEAIALARDKHPDIILMDIRIQGDMDGIETAKRIYQLYGIPIIYLTAHSDDDTIRRAVESGPFGYLIKPFKERELYSNIEMVAHKAKLYQTTAYHQQVQAEVPSPPQSEPPARVQATPMKPGDFRLAVLAVQSVPHPVILFNASGVITFMNNAARSLIHNGASHDEGNRTYRDLPDIFGRIWTSGRDRFPDGKGFATNGPLEIQGKVRRVRIDMIPLMERGTLQFVSSIIFPEVQGGGMSPSGMNTLLDEVENRLAEIRYLASTEETYRLRRISVYTTEVLKKIKELRSISYPGGEKDKQTGNIK